MANEKPSVLAPSLHPSKSRSSNPGGYVDASSGDVGKSGFIETPVTRETPGPMAEADDEEILAAVDLEEAVEDVPDLGAEPWRQAVLFLLDRGMNPPKTERKFRAWLADNDSASFLLAEAKPLLARELSIEIELPTALFRLESSSVQASAKLGRELLDLEMDVEDMIKLVPTKADVIRLSIKEWEKDQIRIMRERLDEAKLTAQQAVERTKAERAAAGHPAVAARYGERKAAERRLVREARARGEI